MLYKFEGLVTFKTWPTGRKYISTQNLTKPYMDLIIDTIGKDSKSYQHTQIGIQNEDNKQYIISKQKGNANACNEGKEHSISIV